MATKTQSKLNIRPLDDRIVVENTAAEEKTAGGILLPETAKEKPQHGKVVATGPGRLSKDGARLPLAVKKGDKVVYGKYAGTDITVEGTEYKILRENEILAKFE
ncbi:MAG: co-chaperone GroES [Planctomycetota bacterium]|jgi:chaperonin GroES